MKNAYAIADIAGLMAKACETIGNVTASLSNAEQNANDELAASYQEVLLNELENVQHMTIAMTQLITKEIAEPPEHSDAGSVFMPGELEDELGDKEAKTEEEEE